MTNTPTKQETQSKNDKVPGGMPGEQKRIIAITIEKEIEEVIRKI